MNHLISIFENTTNGFYVETLDILGILSVLAGIMVITNKNPIGSLISLIMLFGVISVYLIFCGLTFIGFSYLIVYIGAVSILFLFILMLINIRSSELQSNNSNSIPLALFITLLLNYILFNVFSYSLGVLNTTYKKLDIKSLRMVEVEEWNNLLRNTNLHSDNVWLVTSNSWDGNLNETSHISAIGNILYTSYNIWLFMASFILLLAMVGAIVITVKDR
jgi:NADH-ubiquinone oxidoreductase chain 6